MPSDETIEQEHDRVSQLPGVEWAGSSRVKGILRITDEIYVEFNFKGYPSFKIMPKKKRKELPPIIDLLPQLALWEEEDAPHWDELLLELRKKLSGVTRHSVEASMARVDRNMLNGLLKVARDGHPDESIFLLRKDATGIFSEAIMPQGAQGGKTMAYFIPSRLPFDPTIEGSFHSHPSGSGEYSEQDRKIFVRYRLNIVAFYPYGADCFRVYGNRGWEIDCEIVS